MIDVLFIYGYVVPLSDYHLCSKPQKQLKLLYCKKINLSKYLPKVMRSKKEAEQSLK